MVDYQRAIERLVQLHGDAQQWVGLFDFSDEFKALFRKFRELRWFEGINPINDPEFG